jgi:hypothetical protein
VFVGSLASRRTAPKNQEITEARLEGFLGRKYASARLGTTRGDDPIQVKVIDTAGMRSHVENNGKTPQNVVAALRSNRGQSW